MKKLKKLFFIKLKLLLLGAVKTCFTSIWKLVSIIISTIE